MPLPSAPAREFECFIGQENLNGRAAGDAARRDIWVVRLLILEVMVVSLSLAILITMLAEQIPAINWIICTG